MNFESIEYLQNGNEKQQKAYSSLANNQVLSKLKQFGPILVGTIPINIDIENSDLDIICSFSDKQEFKKSITEIFCNEKKFSIRENPNLETLAIVANFFLDGFEIEIFGQTIPTRHQFAYRHLIVEHKLLSKYGEAFRQQIIELKREGYKTEPAFAKALDLTGDPYVELLKLEA
ncbi:MAG TPA: DUF4269 domain-containing protein [Algoriphagus sp.]|nr:DUF4269 domain-containing protein [Algoriphagus sp.]